jgi:hypothetical protein
VGQFIENFFQLRGGGAQEDDVTGGAVHVGDAAAAEFPQVADLFQKLGGVVFAAGLVDAHGVKMGHAGEILRLVAVAADNAAAVTENTHDAAVFPVGHTVFVGEFQYAQKVRETIDFSATDQGQSKDLQP